MKMYRYELKGSAEIEGKAKKIGKAIAVIVDREWEGKPVMVIKDPELIAKIKEDTGDIEGGGRWERVNTRL